ARERATKLEGLTVKVVLDATDPDSISPANISIEGQVDDQVDISRFTTNQRLRRGRAIIDSTTSNRSLGRVRPVLSRSTAVRIDLLASTDHMHGVAVGQVHDQPP